MTNEAFEAETVGIIMTAKNKKVIRLLKNQGKNVVEFPEIKTGKKKLGEKEKQFLLNLEEFDWLVFTDIFTVDYFLEDLTETEFDLYRLDEFKICANGEAVSDKLRFSQLHSDVIPKDNSFRSVLSGISDYIFDEAEFKESKFLVITSEKRKDEISKIFNESGLTAKVIEVYSIIEANQFETAKYRTLFSDDAIDRFIFTSPEDFESLNQFITRSDYEKTKIEFETTDEITTQTLRENFK